MIGIVDRFEGDFSIIELQNGEMKKIKKEKLSNDICEGDVIEFIDGYIKKSYEKTKERKEYIKKLMEKAYK